MIFGSITIVEAAETLRVFLARGSAFRGRRLPMSFLASPHARLTSHHAVAATEPFFRREADPMATFRFEAMRVRDSEAKASIVVMITDYGCTEPFGLP
jgi:hypothetical protein